MSQVLGAMVGALIAGLFLLVGSRRSKRTDHERWLREERLAACVGFLKVVDASLLASLAGPGSLGPAAIEKYLESVGRAVDAKAAVTLCCPDAVVSVADKLAGRVSEANPDHAEVGKLRTEFVREARKALIDI